MRVTWLLLGLCLNASFLMTKAALTREQLFFGMADASAAVPLGSDRFLVADDESVVLRLYSFEKPGLPIQTIDLASFLQVDPNEPEADLEASAQVGDIVYWTGSHGRNKNGKRRQSRERFFATRLTPDGLVPVGQPYKELVRDLTRAPQLNQYNLKAAAKLAPKEPGGLNIEGLAPGPEGTLLIGFRNPVPQGKAVIVPLLNPGELTTGSGASARFGQPIELDLGGDGIRSMLGEPGDYLIAAGAHDGTRRSSLWKWDGKGAPVQVWRARGGDANLEALFRLNLDGAPAVIALSDDGGNKTPAGLEYKELPPNQRRFRAYVVELTP